MQMRFHITFLKFLGYNFVKIEKISVNVEVYEIAILECQTFAFAWLPNTLLHVCNWKIGAQNVLTFISLEKLMYFENWSTKSNNINFSLKLFCLFFICLVSTGYQIHYI